MTTKHRNLSEMVRDHLQSHRGVRFLRDPLAELFDVSPKVMGNCLNGLASRKDIEKNMPAHSNLGKTVYFCPREEDRAPEPALVKPAIRTWKALQINPVLQARAEQAQAHRAQYPSGPSGKVQEMSELDRNKLAFIGATN
jgi:hypothetical protein